MHPTMAVPSTDFESWNHPRRVKLAIPIFAGLGVILGQLLVAPVVDSRIIELFTIGVVALCVIALGIVALAFLD